MPGVGELAFGLRNFRSTFVDIGLFFNDIIGLMVVSVFVDGSKRNSGTSL